MNHTLLHRIVSSPQLPTLPVIALKVLELTRREDVSVPEIAELIMRDPALASKILKTVNSPFYGFTKQISTISQALIILGLQAAKTLALGFSLLTHLKTAEKAGSGFDHVRFWKRSIYAAVGSRVLARRFSVVQHEESFLAGLLANMGVLALHRVMPAEFDALYARSKGNDAALGALCREKIDLAPPEVAQALAEKWQLPPVLVQPIALHLTPEKAEPAIRPLVDAVAAGLVIAEIFVADDSAAAILAARNLLSQRFSLPPQEIEALLQEIGSSACQASAMLDMRLGSEHSYQEILDEAQEALVALSLQSQKHIESIQREIKSLQTQAATDALTLLANRGHFNEFLEEQFRGSFENGRPISLIFIDLDHFKKVNDTHGHLAGDEVLRHVARVLRVSVRSGDLVARFGGEEFAVVLANADTASAAARAEYLRARVAAESIPFENAVIRVTLSAGVAGTDHSRYFSDCGQLTNAADNAVYAAKAAGRNCVRVFRPNPQPANTPGQTASPVKATA